MVKSRPHVPLYSGRKTRPPLRRARYADDTDPNANQLDLENRFKMLQARLNKIDDTAQGPEKNDAFEPLEQLDETKIQTAAPFNGIEIYSSQNNVNVSVSSSSGSTVCGQSVNNMQIRIGNTSKHAKTSVNDIIKDGLLNFQDSSEEIISAGAVRRNIFSRSGSADEANVVIGRRRISSVNYNKRGDTISFTLQDQQSSSRRNEICSHCTCCKYMPAIATDGRLNGTDDSSSDASTDLTKSPATLQSRRQIPGRSGWDTFTQLKKVSTQWREIAKRYVPKSDKEFWKMIREDVAFARDKNKPRLKKVADERWKPNILTEPLDDSEDIQAINIPAPSGVSQDENSLPNKVSSLSQGLQAFDPGNQSEGRSLRVKEWDIGDLSNSS